MVPLGNWHICLPRFIAHAKRLGDIYASFPSEGQIRCGQRS